MNTVDDKDCRKLVRELRGNINDMALGHQIIQTQLASQGSVPIVNNQLVTVPATNGILIPLGSPYNSVLIEIALSDADKLAVGRTILLNSFFSTDVGATWKFINGFTWNSYGPGGLTVTDPDGTVHINPGPRLFVPLNGVKGQLARIQYQANGLTTVGVTVFGIS